MQAVDAADMGLGDVSGLVLPSRVLHLPMAFEEKWTRGAIDKCVPAWQTLKP